MTDNWYREDKFNPRFVTIAVIDDKPERLEIGTGKWWVKREPVDDSGTPFYRLMEGEREVATTLYRNVARRWLGFAPDMAAYKKTAGYTAHYVYK